MKKFLSFVVIIASVLCDNNANAKDTTETVTQTCPPGLFCTQNGQYRFTRTTIGDWLTGKDTIDLDIPNSYFGPAELVVPGWGTWTDEGLCDSGEPSGFCFYIATNYDEVWVSLYFGFYMVKNGDVTYKQSHTSQFPGVFTCPGTYPSSDSGASSVFQCYRITSNGEKEYYKTPNNTHHNYDGNYNTDDVNALLTNLQSAIDQANTASKNLQAVLKKNNNHINVPSREKIITMHANNTNDTPIAPNTNIQPSTGTTNSSTSPTNTTGTTTTVQPTTPSITIQKPSLPQVNTEKTFDFGNLVSPFADRSATQQKRHPTQTTGRTTRVTPQIKKATIQPQSAQQSPAHRSNNNKYRPFPRQ